MAKKVKRLAKFVCMNTKCDKWSIDTCDELGSNDFHSFCELHIGSCLEECDRSIIIPREQFTVDGEPAWDIEGCHGDD